MSLFVVSKTKIDVVRMKSLLESSISKKLIKMALSEKGDGKFQIEKILDAYSDNKIPAYWRIRYYPIFKLLDIIRRSFNRTPEVFREEMKNITIRKIFRNSLRSIDQFGLQTPQTFADPIMIVWNYTNNCNLRCKHCYQDAGVTGHNRPKELTTEERYKAVDILAKRDIPSLFFSGGEPLIEKDFFDVSRYAKEKGFYMSIATNGTLIDDEMAEKIADIGFGYVQVSIDHSDPKMHDKFRGVPGMWMRAVNGIKTLEKHGVTTCIAYTHTKLSHDDFPNMLKLREKLNAYKIIVYNYIPVGRGDFDMDPTPEQREELWHWMYDQVDAGHHIIATTSPAFGAYCKMNQSSSIVLAHYADLKVKELGVIAEVIGGCGAGRAYAALQPDGTLTPCVYMPYTNLGNIMTEDFDYLWNEHPIMKTLRDREHYACYDCPYQAVCGGCRARAYQYFGDFKAPDPECWYTKELYYDFMDAHRQGKEYHLPKDWKLKIKKSNVA